MASKGLYAEGTDGSDHSHRERVADFYKEAADTKKAFWQNAKMVSIAMALCGMLTTARDFLGLSDVAALPIYFYLSAPTIMAAKSAMAKSNTSTMTVFSIISAAQAVCVLIILGLEAQVFLTDEKSSHSAILIGSCVSIIFLLIGLLMNVKLSRALIKIWNDAKLKRSRKAQ